MKKKTKTPDEIKKGLECCANGNLACEGRCVYADDCWFPDCKEELQIDALALIQQLEAKVPKWISVEERLPDKRRDWVLIIGEWVPEGGWIVPHIAEYREGVWITNDTGWNKIEDLRVKVTHWMPLPEPPEV